MQIFDLIKFFADEEFSLKDRRFIAHIEIFDVMTFAQMNAKYYHDEKHQVFFMKSKDSVFIWLYREYNILFIIIFDLKLNQQYADSFKIIKKIECLIYRLKLLQHWRIHLMLSITQLKSSLSSRIDFFDRFKFNHFSSIFVKDDINNIKSYILKKMINKRLIVRRESKYLIK